MMVTRLAWMAQRLVQSIKSSGALTADSAGELHVLGHDGDTLGMEGSEASWRARTAEDWKRSSFLYSEAISRTSLWNGSLRMRSSVDFWKRRISRRATVPGRKRWGFLTPLVADWVFLAAAL